MTYRFTRDDITIRKGNSGYLLLSIVLDGQRIEKTYIDYSEREAVRKFQQEFGIYPKDFVPAGVYAICNHGGIAIMEILHGIDDYVIVCDNYGDGYKNITKNMIKYDRKNRPYFNRYRQKYYLSEFIRCSKPLTKNYYTDRVYGGRFTYEEMVEDAKKNYDYGDPTNFATYQKDWWKENYRMVN